MKHTRIITIILALVMILSATACGTPADNATPAPATDAPTAAPATAAPATDAPTAAPATDAPTAAPATDAPTAAPATAAPSGKVTKIALKSYLATYNKNYADLSGYFNPEVVTAPLAAANAALDDANATQEQVDTALANLKEAVKKLDDGNDLPKISDLPTVKGLPDLYTFMDGTKVTTKEQWVKRVEEISKMYQYYMYGIWPDESKEEMTISVSGNKLTFTIKANGKSISETVTFTAPTGTTVTKPEKGWPVMLGDKIKNFATGSYNQGTWGSDNSSHTGKFYTLYPYGSSYKTQVGALMSWGWGADKVAQALQMANAEGKLLDFDGKNVAVAGVSRYGKGAAVAAFGKHIKLCVPSCSGAGGMGVLRYSSVGYIFDTQYEGKGVAAFTMKTHETLSNIQGSGENYWFCKNFTEFKSPSHLPFEPHFLAALCSVDDRMMFIISAYDDWETWQNPPGMFMAYLAAKGSYKIMGNENRLAIHFHAAGHSIENDDRNFMSEWFYENVYGVKATLDLTKVTTTLYGEEARWKTEGKYQEFLDLLNTQIDVVPEIAKLDMSKYLTRVK